jgi:hypothetical protein
MGSEGTGHHQQHNQNRRLLAADPMPCAASVIPGKRYRDWRSKDQTEHREWRNEEGPVERLAKHLDAVQQCVTERDVRQRPFDELVAPDPGPHQFARPALRDHLLIDDSAGLSLKKRRRPITLLVAHAMCNCRTRQVRPLRRPARVQVAQYS